MLFKGNHKIERISFLKLNYEPPKGFILNVTQWADKKWVHIKKIQLNGGIILSIIMLHLGRTPRYKT